ncbi:MULTISPECIES: IS110 family transposase [Colwellia]|uniref:Transposase for insertion sequence element IS1111A n=1 Tax=Colwellia marinimaniae TaxID=1513592 RepID=A0ABQ0N1J8_9GAMM|nr:MULTISPECIES: IS110 family transposase [Colwellia]GAW97976.1 transposase for insertion sequence element IS1111A [Colwellia marinimaniae]
MYRTKVGVDLAKEVIQVCIYRNKKVQSNIEMTPNEFLCWLVNAKPVTIIFEACGTSNYWKQKAISAGHDARLISAKLVATVRQNQKTDKNDALAIVQAASLPDVTFIGGKTVEQQQLQTIKRLRELAVKHQGAIKKQLVSLLLELNIRISNRKGGIISAIDGVLEDASNGLSVECRIAIDTAKMNLKVSIEAVHRYDDCLENSVIAHADCKKILKLEGVGTMNAINLYLALGCSDIGVFSKGKDASACIGLTPIQHSSGGFVKLGSIGKHCKNSILRSQLICGAMAAVNQAVIREAKTKKDVWIKGLVERRGKKCAAVALANKTVRTAFAMLTQGTEYKAELLAA